MCLDSTKVIYYCGFFVIASNLSLFLYHSSCNKHCQTVHVPVVVCSLVVNLSGTTRVLGFVNYVLY